MAFAHFDSASQSVFWAYSIRPYDGGNRKPLPFSPDSGVMAEIIIKIRFSAGIFEKSGINRIFLYLPG
jgi:hypothetical protein